MKTVNDFNFKDKKALVRVDFNVPQSADLKVTDNTRIVAAKPTIEKILNDGGSVILMTHLGRPKGKKTEEFSLKNLVNEIENVMGRTVLFCRDCIGEDAENMTKNLKPGEILLLENLRFYDEEEKGDVTFAKNLSKYADAYVNDAFGTAHRAHASTAIIAQYFPETKLFGLLMAKELEEIDIDLKNRKNNFTAIIRGSKLTSKKNIIESLIPDTNNIINGSGMEITFNKAVGAHTGE